MTSLLDARPVVVCTVVWPISLKGTFSVSIIAVNLTNANRPFDIPSRLFTTCGGLWKVLSVQSTVSLSSVLKHELWLADWFQGTLIKHLEEHVLQGNLHSTDVMMYYTTVSFVVDIFSWCTCIMENEVWIAQLETWLYENHCALQTSFHDVFAKKFIMHDCISLV